MDFVTAVRYVELGYRVKRNKWSEGHYLCADSQMDTYRWIDNVLADDWEIVKTGMTNDFGCIEYEDEKC